MSCYHFSFNFHIVSQNVTSLLLRATIRKIKKDKDSFSEAQLAQFLRAVLLISSLYPKITKKKELFSTYLRYKSAFPLKCLWFDAADVDITTLAKITEEKAVDAYIAQRSLDFGQIKLHVQQLQESAFGFSEVSRLFVTLKKL